MEAEGGLTRRAAHVTPILVQRVRERVREGDNASSGRSLAWKRLKGRVDSCLRVPNLVLPSAMQPVSLCSLRSGVAESGLSACPHDQEYGQLTAAGGGLRSAWRSFVGLPFGVQLLGIRDSHSKDMPAKDMKIPIVIDILVMDGSVSLSYH